MRKLLARIRDKKGVTIPEYAIMLALVALVVVALVPSMTDGIAAVFNAVNTAIAVP